MLLEIRSRVWHGATPIKERDQVLIINQLGEGGEPFPTLPKKVNLETSETLGILRCA